MSVSYLNPKPGAGAKRTAQPRVSSSEVYERIKRLVIDYRFQPGQRIVIPELADALRVSSTPVREALSRLCAEEHLLYTPNHGFFAKTLNVREMQDLFEFGSLLLQMAVQVGCANASNIGTTHLDNHCLQPDAADSCAGPSVIARVESAYLNAASLASSNEMRRAVVNFIDRTHYIRALDLEDAERRREVVCQIRNFEEALRLHAAEPALSTIRTQFSEQMGRLTMLVKEGVSRLFLAAPSAPARSAPCAVASV
jgi:DNA-binding GntR family transcriptional regulator